ncbi:hypothetical protein BHM03_00047258 [Ensete ventricosum]|nr:hypothetical protein BHM03_00047258 [Ensete ventricosum]
MTCPIASNDNNVFSHRDLTRLYEEHVVMSMAKMVATSLLTRWVNRSLNLKLGSSELLPLYICISVDANGGGHCNVYNEDNGCIVADLLDES